MCLKLKQQNCVPSGSNRTSVPACMMGTKRFRCSILLRSAYVNESPFFSTLIPKIISSPPEGAESHVHQRIFEAQGPQIISIRSPLNSTSLIGTVQRPLTVIDSKTQKFGTYTVLKSVETRGSRPISIMVLAWSELARSCLEHVKVNDCVYVEGELGCYNTNEMASSSRLAYKVTAREVCFVRQAENVKGKGEKRRISSVNERLWLWQVFLWNPGEWWDNRGKKTWKDAPDFKHKSTGECLWLSEYDPPWVKTQLQVLDSQTANQRQCDDSRTDISHFLSD